MNSGPNPTFLPQSNASTQISNKTFAYIDEYYIFYVYYEMYIIFIYIYNLCLPVIFKIK